MKTVLSLDRNRYERNRYERNRYDRTRFLINGKPTYAEIPGSRPESHGLLQNARFIQGIFDCPQERSLFSRFGKGPFDPDRNTDSLIAALPEWYRYGLRAFTVGLQGGGPCFTIPNDRFRNSPYSADGKQIDPAYLARLERLILAADSLSMAVIVSLFYGGQSRHLDGEEAVRSATAAACGWLRDKAFTNVIVEIANEYDVDAFSPHPILNTDEGIAGLLDLAKAASGGLLVGCSGTGAYFSELVAAHSDVILIHGNNSPRELFANLIRQAKLAFPDKPIVCNEDSQAISQLIVSNREQVSWGYYNNMTKQEPPTDWSITPGEDTFFALRMAIGIGIPIELPTFDNQFYLHGFEPNLVYDGKRWIRLASLYPERIAYVDFYRNSILYSTTYEDPFTIGYIRNWIQKPVIGIEPGEEWIAEIHLVDGSVVTKKAIAP